MSDDRTSVVTYVVNADNNRGHELAGELRALRSSEPTPNLLVGIIEATGNDLQPLPGMEHFVGHGPSRGNIAAYVSTRLLGGKRLSPKWHDMKRAWPRTEGPGAHPPRSFAEEKIGRVLVVVAHIPPDAPGSEPARREAVDALVRLLAPWTRHKWSALRVIERKWRRNRPRILLIDANGMKAELCKRADLTAFGDGPDYVMVGGDVRATNARPISTFRPIGGAPVPFRGDHRQVFRVVLSVPSKYFKPRIINRRKKTRHA